MAKNFQHLALIELEASLLGGVLNDPARLTELPAVEVQDFALARHRAVWSAIRNLEATSRPIDIVTVYAECASSGAESVDMAFMGLLILNVPTADNTVEYARRVRSAAIGRRTVIAMQEVLASAHESELDGPEILSAALAALARIDDAVGDGTQSIGDVLRTRIKQLEQIAAERANGTTTMTGFPTGVATLDEKIGGVQPGIATIVAARPAMGKSSFGLALADASSAAGFGVHLFSLEDTEDAYADRTMARGSRVSAEKLRNADLNRGDLSAVTAAVGAVRKRPWLVDGRSAITASEVVRTVRRHAKANRTRVVIVDYIQLLRREDPKARQNTHEALTETLTILADAAKADRMAYVVMSQLNRGVEQRQDKRPQLSDLRESGSLEERAKCVIGLYRGSYYGEPVEGIDWDPDWRGRDHRPSDEEHEATAQIIVLKNNNGRVGTAWARWHGPTTRME